MLLFCLLYAWQLTVNFISHETCARMPYYALLFPHTDSKPLFVDLFFLFFTLYDRIHLTRAGWAAGAGWLEPCGCCHWTLLLPPSLSADALETRWPQHPPSPPPRGAARTEGHACMLTARPQARICKRPWLMHAQVNEKKQTTTSPGFLKLHNPL